MPRSPSPIQLRMLLPLLLSLSTAQSSASTSLPELVEMTAARNPGGDMTVAREALADALQQRADLPLADAPSVNLRYQTDRLGSDNGYREWEGGIEMPLWLPGQADSFAIEADRHRSVASAMSSERVWQIAGEVRSRLWAAASAEVEQLQARSARDAAQKLVEDVRQRMQAGELPRSDLLLAEKELLLRDQVVLEADAQARQAAQRFESYTGVTFSKTLALQGNIPRQTDLETHPKLRLLEQQVSQARAHRDRIMKTLRSGPSLWLGGKTARDTRPGSYESSVGIEINVPLGEETFNAPQLAEAEQALTETLTKLSRIRLELEDELSQAQIAFDSTSAAIDKTRRSQELAEESLRLGRRAFELGETGLIDLLRAQNDALRARNTHELSRLRHAQAIARLNQALGVIPQ